MASVASRIRRIRMQLEQEAHKGLNEAAENMAAFARAQAEMYWQDDSGSARASITGFDPEVSSHDKNFGNPAWKKAQSVGYVSPRHENPHTNFGPFTESVDKEEEYEAYLTAYVQYFDDIRPERGSGEELGKALFQETMDATRYIVLSNLASAIEKALRA